MFDTNEISVTLNALDSTLDIYAKETASGQTTLSLKVSSILPNQQSKQTSITQTVRIIAEAAYTVTAPLVNDQTYIVAAAQGSYEVPDFTLSPAMPALCNSPIVYSSTVTNTDGLETSWITQTTSGKGVQWQTNDPTLAGAYTVLTTATLDFDASVT